VIAKAKTGDFSADCISARRIVEFPVASGLEQFRLRRFDYHRIAADGHHFVLTMEDLDRK
jgi:hypothetical protein